MFIFIRFVKLKGNPNKIGVLEQIKASISWRFF